MRIFLTRRAERNYLLIREFITHKWGEKVAGAFEQKTVDFLDLLQEFPEIGAVEVPVKQIRAFPLSRQIKIFYRIKGEKIIVLNFFDVRQHPNKKNRL